MALEGPASLHTRLGHPAVPSNTAGGAALAIASEIGAIDQQARARAGIDADRPARRS